VVTKKQGKQTKNDSSTHGSKKGKIPAVLSFPESGGGVKKKMEKKYKGKVTT